MSRGGGAAVAVDDPELDAIFSALASPARRTMLVRLAAGPASVSELSTLVTMSQPAVSKNLKVLEQAGLIARGRDAQRRPRMLRPETLAVADEWVATLRRTWEGRLDRLGSYLAGMGSDPIGADDPTAPADGAPPPASPSIDPTDSETSTTSTEPSATRRGAPR
jgi:DNA-binding transcriptional ArsR family regulator